MEDELGLGFRLRLLDMMEPWRSPINWLNEVAYENFKDIDLRTVLLCLRDMPYRPPEAGHTSFDCLNEWCGTAIAKSFATYDLLRRIGLKPRIWMASYAIVPCLPVTDDTLAKIARKHRVMDVHVFLTCDFGGGERVVDFTFPARLRDEGFVVTMNWGRSRDCALPCALLERREITADAQGLCKLNMWLKQLNPGVGMRYHALVQENVIALAARSDVPDTRKRYIHRSYLRLTACEAEMSR